MSDSKPRNVEDFVAGLRHPESGASLLVEPDLDGQLVAAKGEAVRRGDEKEASQVWCAQTIAEVQRQFAAAFAKMKAGMFYDAWCSFERCEIALGNLLPHFDVDASDSHRLEFIGKMVERWQSLYPYKVFFSPELLKKKILCSVCRRRVTPRGACGHKKGNLYGGEMCFHIVEEVEFLSLSVVEQPVQRYSVAFLANEDGTQRDHYNYGNVKFVVDRVASPYHEWTQERMTRLVNAAEVSHLPAQHPCPCLSGKIFAECCGTKTQFEVPHLQLTFAVPPPRDLPSLQLLL